MVTCRAVRRPQMSANKWHKVAGSGDLLCHFAILETVPEQGDARELA